jgi:hypothetical protein
MRTKHLISCNTKKTKNESNSFEVQEKERHLHLTPVSLQNQYNRKDSSPRSSGECIYFLQFLQISGPASLFQLESPLLPTNDAMLWVLKTKANRRLL